MILCWGRATPVARLFMLIRTASFQLAHAYLSELEARGPEDMIAPLEWRTPSHDQVLEASAQTAEQRLRDQYMEGQDHGQIGAAQQVVAAHGRREDEQPLRAA